MILRFDRGTLILSEPPNNLEFGDVPGVTWDPRTSEFRAPAHRYNEVVTMLRQRNLEVEDHVRPKARLNIREPVSLRPYQESALHAWQLGERRGIVALPTGSGKTRLALAAIAASNLPALVLVPTRVLLAQWCQEIENCLGVRPGCFGDGEFRHGLVTVATFESAYRHMSRIGNEFDLLIIDEVHHFGSGVREEVLVMSAASLRLGLTATPPKDIAAITRLRELLGPVVYELAIADLTGEYLAEYELTTLTLPLNENERAVYELDMARFRPVCRQFFRLNPMATWADFIRFANQTDDGRRALESWRRARSLLSYIDAKRATLAHILRRFTNARILVFTADNETSYAIAREFLIMPITCDIKRRERAKALERFRTGELRALVSARVLNEGLDVPDADVAVIVGGGTSEREQVQRIGRLLRPSPGKRAQVFELVAADTTEVRHAQRRRQGLGCHRESSRHGSPNQRWGASAHPPMAGYAHAPPSQGNSSWDRSW